MNSRKQDDEVMSSKIVLKGIAELLPRSFVDDDNGQRILTGQLIFVNKMKKLT